MTSVAWAKDPEGTQVNHLLPRACCKSLYCLYPENGLSLDAEWCKTAPPSARVQLGRVLLSLPLMLLRCACR